MVLSQLSAVAAPRQFERLRLDATVARTDVAFKLAGFGFVVTQQGASEFLFRLNEPDGTQMSFKALEYVRHPFHSLYISNSIGTGTLEVCIFKTQGVDLGLRGVGLDEVIARQGGPSLIDRQGSVVFSDIIHDGLVHLVAVGSGTGAGYAVITRDSSVPVSNIGAQSIELTGGSDGAQTCWAGHRHLLPHGADSGLLGYEATYSLDNNVDFALTGMTIYDGQLRWEYAVRLERNTKKLGVYIGPRDGGVEPYGKGTTADASYVSTTIYPNHTGSAISNGEWMFHTVKLVIDLANKSYHRVMINGVPIDVSGIVAPDISIADTASPYLTLDNWVVSESGNNGQMYLDNYIFTMNEPRTFR